MKNNKKNIMTFEGMQLDFLIKEDVNFEFEGDVLFSGKQTAEVLGYVNTTDALKRHIGEDCKYLVKNSDIVNPDFRKLNNAGETFINEDGVIDLTYRSDLPQAEKFRKQVREMIKQVNKTGRYDVIENQLQEVEDETEKTLNLKIYKFEQILEIDPTDRMTLMSLNETKSELQLYKQQKQLKEIKMEVKTLTGTVEKVKEENETLKKIQTYVCDRTNFHEKVVILANKYFGRNKKTAYKTLYSRVKTLGSFDVYARRQNEWDKINLEREEEGLKPYKDSTLNNRYGCLDVIDAFNKWDLINEAYRSIELEMVS